MKALLLALALLAQDAAEPPESGAVVLELRLEGPLEAVELVEAGRPTRVELPLAAGERRTVLAPLSLWTPARSGAEVAGRVALTVAPASAAGEAAIAAVPDPRPDLWSAGLPTTLALRTRPPLEPPSPRPDPVRLALLAAAWAGALALRRRPAVALAAAALGSAAILALPAAPAPAGEVLVLEGDARAGRWLAVRGALDALEVEPGRVPWTDVLGAGEPTRWVVELPPGAAPVWRLEGAGRQLYALEELPAAPLLDRERHAGPPLAEVWVREPSGAWSAHGPWTPGAPLPAARPGDPPPGWLAAGLPQGVGVLLARLDPQDPAAAAPRARVGWLRLVGF